MFPFTQSAEQLLLARWAEALTTPHFSARSVTLSDLYSALEPAQTRSFQRLVQALLREGLVAATDTVLAAQPFIEVPHANATLRFDYLRPGRMNSWDVRGHINYQVDGQTSYRIAWPSELLTALSGTFEQAPEDAIIARLAAELDDSLINDTLCLAYHNRWSHDLSRSMASCGLLQGLRRMEAPANPSILLEQWGTLGHPWHPNYKTKLGLTTQQVVQYSPEFCANVGVRLYALHRQYAHIERLPDTDDYWQWWQQRFPQAASQLQDHLLDNGLEAADYVPLPVHPWQAEQSLYQAFAGEISDRLLVPTDITAFNAAPTMSFRTVLPEASLTAPMVKLPVSLRLTSVQRTVSPRSARMGPRVSQLLLQMLEREPAIAALLDIVPERIGVHYTPVPRNDDRARHLGVLYRDNPASRLAEGEIAIPVGSLFATDEAGRPLLRQWVLLTTGRDDSTGMLDFFQRYIGIAVPSLLGMYLKYGVAFEAHQQNSFMVMGADGAPARLLIRDFGDIRIHRATLHAHGMDLALHDPSMTLFDDDAFVRDKLLHTTFMCHLGELVLLCARHWETPQAALWGLLAEEIERCFNILEPQVLPSRWQQEHDALLQHDWPAKSFMRMRLLDSHADIVGRLANPLRNTPDEG